MLVDLALPYALHLPSELIFWEGTSDAALLLLLAGALGLSAFSIYKSIVLRNSLQSAQSLLRQEIETRWEAEKKLREQESRLRTIIDSEPECVKLHDNQGKILEMNPAGCTMVDAACLDEVIGISVYKLIAPEYRDKYRSLTDAVFNGRPGTLEFRLIGLRGTERVLETYAVPLRDVSGGIVALLGLTRDITERKRAEEKERQHLADLAHVARLSTMGEMAAGIAHELNQPLTAIMSHIGACLCQTQSSEFLSDETRASLKQISEQALRAGQIIRNVRELAQKIRPKRVQADVNEIVSLAATLMEPEARQSRVFIDLQLAENLPPVWVERVEIEQVILNLLKNGVEAAREVPVSRRHIKITTGIANGDLIEVLVSDAGPGLSDEQMHRVFDPFFTTKEDGVGMGLSISRSIIESHGSCLEVRPNGDFGVTFSFNLPVAAEEPVS